jgi:hypothetical protein
LSDTEKSINYIRYTITDLLSKFGGLLSTILVASALIAKQINKQFFLAKVIEGLFFIQVKEFEKELKIAETKKIKNGKFKRISTTSGSSTLL